jgi:hypothetical protein
MTGASAVSSSEEEIGNLEELIADHIISDPSILHQEGLFGKELS